MQSVYEAFRDEIVEQVRRDGPFDVVPLELHGAMVSTACDDCEGDLIAHVREVVGSRGVIGVKLDPHCHLSGDYEWPVFGNYTDFVGASWRYVGSRFTRFDPGLTAIVGRPQIELPS